NVNDAIRYVFPTWRGNDMPTPSIVDASHPSSRFARMRLPTWSCHGSRETPIFSRSVLRTAGHPVATAPFGAATFRAISESLEGRCVERFILDDVRGISTLLPRPQINRLNLLSDVLQTTRQRRQITRRTLRIRNSR